MLGRRFGDSHLLPHQLKPAGQLGVYAADLGFYEWSGSTIEYTHQPVNFHHEFPARGTSEASPLTAEAGAGLRCCLVRRRWRLWLWRGR
jgi:hypothetical protein